MATSGVNVKMGVDVSQFKQGMQQAQQSVKTLDAQLKLNEKQLKANGDAELYMSNKAKLLDQQLAAQQKVVSGLYKQLDEMKKRGVDETSEAYQKLERSIYNAAGKMMDIQAEINSLTASEQKAAAGASTMEQNLRSINRKVSFDAVIKGVDAITNGLEKAVKKATDLGKAIWENITDAARWGDDTATGAMTLGMDVEEYQKYKNVLERYGEITIAEWQKAKQKVQKAMYDPTNEQVDILRALGIGIREGGNVWQNNYTSLAMRDFEDVFWDIGRVLKEKVESGQMTQDLADTYANALFGRGFAGLNSMFGMGREEFKKKIEEETAVQEQYVKQLADLNDAQDKLKTRFEQLEQTVTGALAPALTGASEALSGLLENLLEYLNKPEGQEMLQRLGDAVSGLFEDLKNIDPEDVVNSFVTLFTKLVDSFEWITKNWEGVKAGLFAIVGVITAGKTISALTTMLQTLNALKSFGNGGGAPTAQPTTQPTGGDGGTGATGGKGLWATIKGWGAKIGAEWSALGGAWTLAPAAVAAVGIIPGLAAQAEATDKLREEQEELRNVSDKLAEENSENAKLVATVAEKGYLVTDENGNEKKNILGQSYSEQSDDMIAALMGLQDRQNAEKAKLMLALAGAVNPMTGNYAWTDLNKLWNGELEAGDTMELGRVVAAALGNFSNEDLWKWSEPAEKLNIVLPQTTADMENVGTAADDAAAALNNAAAAAAGWPSGGGGGSGYGYTLGAENVGLFGRFGFHANGLFSVPWDGYPAILHKGERVVPARAAGGTYSSNLYVENMNMSGGVDAAGLAAAMAAAQRRTMSGFGS